MTELDISKTTTPTTITDYSVNALSPDSPQNQKENYWYNSKFTTYFGNYKAIAKIKKAIDGYATWILGQGYTNEMVTDEVRLENISGWGEDTFNAILWNMIVTKKIGGDSYSEIIRDNGILINLKPLNPQYIRHVVNEKGIIKRYDYMVPSGNKPVQEFQPDEILHLCNNRVVDEMHGVSDIEAVVWNVEATQEAMRAHRKMVKRNGVRN